MSGIVALFRRTGGPISAAEVPAMLAAASHRGPDGTRVHISDSVALGYAKFAATPEDVHAVWQPLVSRTTGCSITADVRLDNRQELAAQIGEAATIDLSDAELILRAYEAVGRDIFPRLLGDFAFILWDPRQQTMLCVRDHSGQRRVFYRISDDTFAAASEIQQLLQDPAVPIRINEERILQGLLPRNMLTNVRDSADTYFEGIYAVPPASVLEVKPHSMRLDEYWSLDASRQIRHRNHDEYVEHFRDVFFSAIQARLRTADPLGSFLSGGLDSSSITTTAQLILESQGRIGALTGFSLTFDGLDCDERPFIREIQEKSGVSVSFVPREQGPELRVDLSGFMESPHVGVGFVHGPVFEAAETAGLRVLLSGEVADNCIGGSRFVFDSLLRALALREFAYHWRAFRRVTDDSLKTSIFWYCLAPLLPLAIHKELRAKRIQRYFAYQGHKSVPDWIHPGIRSQFIARTGEMLVANERNRRFRDLGRQWEYEYLSPVEDFSYASSWSLEVWRPFADRRLQELLFAVPPEEKFRPDSREDNNYASSKRLLRDAMVDILPEKVRRQTEKVNFTSVLQNEIISHWTTYEAVFGPKTEAEIVRRGYVDANAFWKWLSAIRDGTIGGDYTYLRGMIRLEMWLRLMKQPRSSLLAKLTDYGHPPHVVNSNDVSRARNNVVGAGKSSLPTVAGV